MISGVTFEAGGVSHTLRLTTRAMLSLERKAGKPINDILGGLREGIDVKFVVQFVGFTMNNGKGADEEEALDLVDECGGPFEILPKITEAIEAAFPAAKEAKGQAASGAGKRKAAQSK